MQTHFSLAALADPKIAECEKILRACVHCGFCTATCPTYLETGDELDSPRGRIYLVKEMLESGRAGDERTARHLDRCLSCLSCMTTCPSGVDYMHLVDHARAHVEATWERPAADRALRALLAALFTRPAALRAALRAARFSKPLAPLLPPRLRAMLRLAPDRLPTPSPVDHPQVMPAAGPRKLRVALLTGCAQTVLAPRIHEATVRLLNRCGVEVVVAQGTGCCGALPHHLGRTSDAVEMARRNVAAWSREIAAGGLDHIVVDASGCGTTLKDYGHLLRGAPEAEAGARIAAMTHDVSELLAGVGYAPSNAPPRLRIVYHSACSLQHGQKVTSPPVELLRRAGFEVVAPVESHICCGSAGTYNMLQPELAAALGARKAGHLEATGAQAVAAGNLGCLTQIAAHSALPAVHTSELLDWAAGGPKPAALSGV